MPLGLPTSLFLRLERYGHEECLHPVHRHIPSPAGTCIGSCHLVKGERRVLRWLRFDLLDLVEGQTARPRLGNSEFQRRELFGLQCFNPGEFLASVLLDPQQFIELGVHCDVAAKVVIVAKFLAIEHHLGEGDGKDR